MIYLLASQYEHVGILDEVVVQADKASVAQQPERAITAPQTTSPATPRGRSALPGAGEAQLNHPNGPADGWPTQDALWLLSKPAADPLRAYMLTRGIDGVPASNTPFFNMLQDQATIQTNAQDKAIWKATVDNGCAWKNSMPVRSLVGSSRQR